MSIPSAFLDYNGKMDLSVIENLLAKLKNSVEFNSLNILSRKRIYSIFVECIENIYKHSALKESEEGRVQPYISAIKTDDAFIIRCGNTIVETDQAGLASKIALVNRMSLEELRKMHEARLGADRLILMNGAGLGLICMALKSENKLEHSFTPLIPGYQYFEIQMLIKINAL
jgi:hypothetical protein